MTNLLQNIPSPTKIREELEQMVLKDLLGPVGGPEEEIDEPSVRDRYLVSPLTKLDRNSGPGYAVGVPFCSEGDSLCVVVSRACCPLPLPTKTVCTQPLIVTACPGIKCGGSEFCWLSLPVSASVMSPLKCNAA